MEENFPSLLRHLTSLDQEEALIQERIFTLTHVLAQQHELLHRLYDTRSTIEVLLSRLTQATFLYEPQSTGENYDASTFGNATGDPAAGQRS